MNFDDGQSVDLGVFQLCGNFLVRMLTYLHTTDTVEDHVESV